MVDVLVDVAMVDRVVPLLLSYPHLLPRLLDNDATIFVVVVVGPCCQDRGGGEKQPLPPMPPPPPMGGRDTPENEEFCRRHSDCDVYINRAMSDGSANA
jgi:hypothetical protein